jgi:hypothetical protein
MACRDAAFVGAGVILTLFSTLEKALTEHALDEMPMFAGQ